MLCWSKNLFWFFSVNNIFCLGTHHVYTGYIHIHISFIDTIESNVNPPLRKVHLQLSFTTRIIKELMCLRSFIFYLNKKHSRYARRTLYVCVREGAGMLNVSITSGRESRNPLLKVRLRTSMLCRSFCLSAYLGSIFAVSSL